ncbi:hypothetical protein Tco_0866375 [Tanacetum coccineum]
MEELLQAPTDGVGDAIVEPPVLASQFELKIGLLSLVTIISFHGFENDDPHSHIRRPSVPSPHSSYSKEVEGDPETITDHVLTESTTRDPPLVVQLSPASRPSELPPAPSFVIPERNLHQPSIPYPSRLNKEKLQDKSDIQIHSFLQLFRRLHFNISLAEALAHMSKYVKMVKDLLTSKEKLLELVNTPLNENCLDVLLKKLPEKLRDTGRSLILFDYDVDPCVPLILGRPFLRTTRALVDVHGEELTLRVEEIATFLASDDLISPNIDDEIFDPEGDIRLIEELLNNEILNDLPPPLHGTSKLPVIIAKNLKREEKEQLLKVSKSHKRAIAWKVSDIRGIDPKFCTHKILMEDDFKPAV